MSRIFFSCSSSCSCRTFIVCSAVRVSWSASARASWLTEITFWPTRMIGSSTSWRNDWLSQETPTKVSPCMKASSGLECLAGFGHEPDEQCDGGDVLKPPRAEHIAQPDAGERDRRQVCARDRFGDIGPQGCALDDPVRAALRECKQGHHDESRG